MSRPGIEPVTSRSSVRTLYQLSYRGQLSGKYRKQNDSGYPHDGRADKNPYPHDRRADEDSYPHDSNNQCIILRLRDD